MVRRVLIGLALPGSGPFRYVEHEATMSHDTSTCWPPASTELLQAEKARTARGRLTGDRAVGTTRDSSPVSLGS